ncbi:hypothetical protein CVT25_001025 [Psilocybe cyanescens]|uniref:Beta-glucuronidase C-terminal domain-containing protein n=1 Tax=Psilocybe cyanescens TaxID=93625 RepID=A0A409WZ73_PSICY|nr:hypothetical protein CVT25_001025 [Psilocybe cyanescens]
MFWKTLGSSLLLLFLLLLAPLVSASVTVWYQEGQKALATATGSAEAASYTGSAAYNPVVLQAPPPPGASALPTAFGLALQPNVPLGASIIQTGGFFGFSIEMSVVNQVFPFLNLMANIQERTGRIFIRVGGNTQETAVLVDHTSDGRILEKDLVNVTNPVSFSLFKMKDNILTINTHEYQTATPPLIFTKELLYMLRNISSLVNVQWYLGVPFNDTSNFRLAIAEQGELILGDYLVGMQVGNEPDLYADHGHRPATYGPYDYFGEFGDLVNAMNGDTNIANRELLIGPSVSTGRWTPEQVWNTGFVDSYSSSLAYLSVEHYPTDNCYAQYGVGTPRDPQSIFPSYLTHTAGQSIIAQYLNSTQYAQTKNKRLLMFETNTASCGGFPGISDAFGAALWGLDYAMQLAYSNFSGALFHVGGQNVYYNPFTPPPTNQSTFRKWSIGPIYYAALVMAEAMGPSNNTQVIDLQANSNNVYSPAYAIYEAGTLQRVLLFNYATDNTGGSDLQVSLTLNGATIPDSVQVKYLLAASAAQKGNYTWAGQTFGVNFASDGRLMGAENIQSATCPGGTCTIKVPAPGVALVFMSPGAMTDGKGAKSETFSTTYLTRTRNTVSVDPSVLATSNGHTGMDKIIGSTSEGSEVSAAEVQHVGIRRILAALGIGMLGSWLLLFGAV